MYINSLVVRQASAPECVSPAQQWTLADRGDEFVLQRKRKLEVSDDANAPKREKETKIQASNMDPETARDDVDKVNMHDIVSLASSKKTRNLGEVISQPPEKSK